MYKVCWNIITISTVRQHYFSSWLCPSEEATRTTNADILEYYDAHEPRNLILVLSPTGISLTRATFNAGGIFSRHLVVVTDRVSWTSGRIRHFFLQWTTSIAKRWGDPPSICSLFFDRIQFHRICASLTCNSWIINNRSHSWTEKKLHHFFFNHKRNKLMNS